MKTKSSSIIIIVVLCIGAISSILFFRPDTVSSLFSRSINSGEMDSGVPATQSLDGKVSEEAPIDRAQQIKDLEQELLKTEDNPDKALEIRRRLQILRAEIQK